MNVGGVSGNGLFASRLERAADRCAAACAMKCTNQGLLPVFDIAANQICQSMRSW